MSKQIGDTIFAKQGESIPFNIPVYGSDGSLVTNITSAKIVYFGGDMLDTVEASCNIVAGGTIQYTIPKEDSFAIQGLIKYEIMATKTGGTADEPIESGFIIIKPTLFAGV